MIFRGSQVLMVMSFFVLLILVGTIGYELIEGGGGSMGRQLMQELEGAKKQCVIVERYPEAVEALQKINPDVLVVEDNATEDRVLTEAGIDRAMGLVTCLSGDTGYL